MALYGWPASNARLRSVILIRAAPVVSPTFARAADNLVWPAARACFLVYIFIAGLPDRRARARRRASEPTAQAREDHGPLLALRALPDGAATVVPGRSAPTIPSCPGLRDQVSRDALLTLHPCSLDRHARIVSVG